MRDCPATFFKTRRRFFHRRREFRTGQAWGVDDLVTYLQRSGYRPEADENSLGEYTVDGNVVDIKPSKLSYFGGTNDYGGSVQWPNDQGDPAARWRTGHGHRGDRAGANHQSV